PSPRRVCGPSRRRRPRANARALPGQSKTVVMLLLHPERCQDCCMSISRVAVVGAGVLGVAAAREVTNRLPAAEVTVFDQAQSGHTSGIVDSGLEQTPGSTAAALARRGVQLLIPYMAERGVAYRECGQLLIAQDTDEAERLEQLFAQAEDNGIPGVRLLERQE